MNSLTNKSDAGLTAMWVNFFTAAGIPSDVSATYALTFTENRIQTDMLLDLNKEYLRDMGITRMGDVIAILRHAKQVHENTARDRVLGTTASSAKVPVAAIAGRLTISHGKSSSPASRMLEHYTRKSSSAETSPNTSPSQKRRIGDSGDSTLDAKKSRLIRFAPSPPAPATLAKEVVSVSSKTVFARLGTSDDGKTVANNSATCKSIYARLGAKSNDIEKHQFIPISKDALKYEGILKNPPEKQTVTVITSKDNVRRIACTMRADEAPISIREKLAVTKTKSVKFSERVEYKEIEKNDTTLKPKFKPKLTSVFNKPERRLSMPENNTTTTNNNGIKARLGSKSNNLTITRNIFNRLGV